MEGQIGQTGENPSRLFVSLFGKTGYPTSLHSHQGEFARDKKSVDEKEERDECQTGGRTNWKGPSGSRLPSQTNGRRNVSHPRRNLSDMLIDCDQCAMRETSACDDCVVTCLLDHKPVEFSDNVAQALDNLADEGLVPRLRLIPAERRVS